jgi:hypothetical protein
LAEKRRATLFEIARHYDYTLKELSQDLRSLMARGYIRQDGGEFSLAAPPPKDAKRPAIREILKLFERLAEGRPRPKKDHWQGFMSARSTVRRAAFIHSRCDDAQARAFLLGDDDLLSLAIALMGAAKQIIAADIDPDIVRFINEAARSGGLPVRAIKLDANLPLPDKYRGRFDLFITEPPETLAGLRLFLARGFESLKGEGSVAYFGLTHIEASLRKWQQIERFILDSNFAITDILRDFSIYSERENNWSDFYLSYPISREWGARPPRSDWYRSSFIRLEAIGPIKLSRVERLSPRELFTDEESWLTDVDYYK